MYHALALLRHHGGWSREDLQRGLQELFVNSSHRRYSGREPGPLELEGLRELALATAEEQWHFVAEKARVVLLQKNAKARTDAARERKK